MSPFSNAVSSPSQKVIFAAFLFLAASSTAQPGKAPHKPFNSSIILAGDHQYPPFHFLDEKGKATGFDVELFRTIAERQNLAVDIQLGNWGRKLEELEIGNVDVIPMFVSEERKSRFLFTEPFMTRYHLMFGHAQSPYLPSLDDLDGQRVAVQYGGLAWETLRAMPEKFLLIPVSVESEAITALARGEADYALVPMTIGYASMLHHGLKNIATLSPPLLHTEYAFAVTPKRPELVNVINEGLRVVKVSGQQDGLYMKWLANLTPPRDSYRSGMMIGVWAAAPLLVLTIIVFYWWRRAKYRVMLETKRADKEADYRQSAEARVSYLAFHDTITDLPNRNGFDRAIATALGKSGGCAIVRLDLLGLDLIHAIAGNSVSHSVLKAVAARLVSRYGKESLAHLGHGKFIVNLGQTLDTYKATQKTQALINLVQQRYQVTELPIDVGCRAGVALFPQHGQNAAELFRFAELACISAQEHGLTWRIFEPSLIPDERNLTLLADLLDAIANGTLDYALQPQLNLSTQQVIGAELLVRWNHPRFGPLPPNVFVPLAEKTGVINQMTMYLMLKAIKHCQEWKQQGLNISISVNVSGNDLADEFLVNTIIEQCGDVCDRLILELTETEVMRDMERVLAAVEILRTKGIRISLDDFGTGYSSLSYLQRLNPDELKIDRSFISQLSTSPGDQSIVRSIILLAHELDAKVVAEGIEDPSSQALLGKLGCDIGQGYVIARPMPLEEFIGRTDLAQS